jgi:hypothetical protein
LTATICVCPTTWPLATTPCKQTTSTFVKTAVRLASPVHPDWKERIENSLVINLAVRKSCHDAIGGFPDYHLYRRVAEQLRPETDVFYQFEDLFDHRLVATLYRGRKLPLEPVEYGRHPGAQIDADQLTCSARHAASLCHRGS